MMQEIVNIFQAVYYHHMIVHICKNDLTNWIDHHAGIILSNLEQSQHKPSPNTAIIT